MTFASIDFRQSPIVAKHIRRTFDRMRIVCRPSLQLGQFLMCPSGDFRAPLLWVLSAVVFEAPTDPFDLLSPARHPKQRSSAYARRSPAIAGDVRSQALLTWLDGRPTRRSFMRECNHLPCPECRTGSTRFSTPCRNLLLRDGPFFSVPHSDCASSQSGLRGRESDDYQTASRAR